MASANGRALTKEVVELSIGVLERAKESAACSVEEQQAVRHLCSWLSRLDLEDSSDTDESLDAPSRALLADYRSSVYNKRLRGLGEVMGTSPSLRSTLVLDRIQDEEQAALSAELDKLSDWNNFDIFRVRDLSDGWPLTTVSEAILERFDLISKLQLNKRKLRSFLKDVEAAYRENPYHNSTHAADVTQSLGCILANDDFSQHLTDIELLAMIVSAAVHDVGHPGVSNDFLVASEHQTALEYNDIHVNENMHAALAFQILSKPANSFFPVSVDPEVFKFFRRTVISIVLATDMASHEELVNSFQTNMSLSGPQLSDWQAEKRAAALQMVVHCADISNPAKPVHLSTQWSDRVLTEFFAQGDKEKQEGMRVSPQCDREQVNRARSQLVFLERVVKPCFNMLRLLAPKSASIALCCAENARKYWESLIEEEGLFTNRETHQ